MRITIFIFVFQVGFVLGQAESRLAMISLRSNNVLIWNIENFVEFQGSEDFDSTWLYSEDCYFIGKNVYSGYIIPKSLKLDCTATLMGLKGNDTIRDASFRFTIVRLPTPEIRLGPNFNLKTDLNRLNDSTLFYNRYFKAQYSHILERLLDNHQLRFMKVIQWKILIGNSSFQGDDNKLTQELIREIENSSIGTPIIFEYFKISMPDGREIEVELNSQYIKTTPSGTKLPKPDIDYIHPIEN